jgi:DME family drug/metabolite transporter
MAYGILFLLSASLLFSTVPILAKIVYSEGLPPIWLIEFRLFFAFCFFSLLVKKGKLKEIKSNLKNLSMLAVFGLAANYFFYHQGLEYTTASSAQVLESLSPVFVLFIALALKEEIINSKKSFGIFLTALGSVVIFNSHIHLSRLIFGDILEIFAAITWGYFIVQSNRVMRVSTPNASLIFIFGFSALLFLPLALATPLTLTSKLFSIALMMGFLHTFIAYLLYFEGIKRTNPTSAAVTFALSPILTVILETKILGAISTPLFYLGISLAIIGIIIVIRQRKK